MKVCYHRAAAERDCFAFTLIESTGNMTACSLMPANAPATMLTATFSVFALRQDSADSEEREGTQRLTGSISEAFIVDLLYHCWIDRRHPLPLLFRVPG
jgi:hypothetical protein